MNYLIVKTLKKKNYSVDACYDGEEALLYLSGAQYDAVVLDVMLPKLDGYEVLRKLREKDLDTPVLFLTARDAVADRVKGLDLGADDYLVKPFSFDELLARIRAITRKRAGSRSNLFSAGGLSLDIERRTVTRDGTEITLLPKEFTILEYMIRNQGVVLSREQLENQIWNYEYSGSSNNIDGYISRLRKKIDSGYEDKLIHTIRGVGWVLRVENKKMEVDPDALEEYAQSAPADADCHKVNGTPVQPAQNNKNKAITNQKNRNLFQVNQNNKTSELTNLSGKKTGYSGRRKELP